LTSWRKGYEPENTLFLPKALDMQVWTALNSTHLSADGEIIVIHDETIDRTTNGKGFVNTLSLRELKSFSNRWEIRNSNLKRF
jgi:glycerophosphoryl diester phosphodiesterase